VPYYWSENATLSYEGGDSVLVMVFSNESNCSVILKPHYQVGFSINETAIGDTARMVSADIDLGEFRYNRGVKTRICKDLEVQVKSLVSVSHLVTWTVTANPSSFVFDNGGPSFYATDNVPGTYSVTVLIDGIDSYCWETFNPKTIIIRDEAPRYVPGDSIIAEIISEECEKEGGIILTENIFNSNWQSITVDNDTYVISSLTSNLIKSSIGFKEVHGYDADGCSFYSDDVEVPINGECEGDYYSFSILQPSVVEFKNEGKIIIRNRAGQKVVELNCPCLWDGKSSSGFLDYGLYLVEHPDGSVKKLKYYH
jgi:hypothetical protein